MTGIYHRVRPGADASGGAGTVSRSEAGDVVYQPLTGVILHDKLLAAFAHVVAQSSVADQACQGELERLIWGHKDARSRIEGPSHLIRGADDIRDATDLGGVWPGAAMASAVSGACLH